MVAIKASKNSNFHWKGPDLKNLPDFEDRHNLMISNGLMNNISLPRLIFMTDKNQPEGPQTIVRSLPSGSAVILRHYGDPNRVEIARQLIAETRGRHISVLIAGDARLALRVGAQGIHVPEEMARHCAWKWQNWVKPSWLVTAAAHSPKALLRAKQLGAHAALLSPVFTTSSHPNSRPLGVLRFASWCTSSPIAIYALGGVTKANARRLKGCNFHGIAGISDFINNC